MPVDGNLCMACGACCACFPVPVVGSVLDENACWLKMLGLAVPAKNGGFVMRGTMGRSKRCVGLEGIVGKKVWCAIYDHRPGACRGFGAGWENGVINPKCARARMIYGLQPFSEY